MRKPWSQEKETMPPTLVEGPLDCKLEGRDGGRKQLEEEAAWGKEEKRFQLLSELFQIAIYSTSCTNNYKQLTVYFENTSPTPNTTTLVQYLKDELNNNNNNKTKATIADVMGSFMISYQL